VTTYEAANAPSGVDCPVCKAKVGEPCWDSGQARTWHHIDRVFLSRKKRGAQ
jgi:hypothetical protein